MTDLVRHRFPWEPVPVEETVAALQRDMAYLVRNTAVVVHSNRPELRMVINTPRGQLVPRGECRFMDGTTIEFQDVGAPQVGASEMSVRDLVSQAWSAARELGLELENNS